MLQFQICLLSYKELIFQKGQDQISRCLAPNTPPTAPCYAIQPTNRGTEPFWPCWLLYSLHYFPSIPHLLPSSPRVIHASHARKHHYLHRAILTLAGTFRIKALPTTGYCHEHYRTAAGEAQKEAMGTPLVYLFQRWEITFHALGTWILPAGPSQAFSPCEWLQVFRLSFLQAELTRHDLAQGKLSSLVVFFCPGARGHSFIMTPQ